MAFMQNPSKLPTDPEALRLMEKVSKKLGVNIPGMGGFPGAGGAGRGPASGASFTPTRSIS